MAEKPLHAGSGLSFETHLISETRRKKVSCDACLWMCCGYRYPRIPHFYDNIDQLQLLLELALSLGNVTGVPLIFTSRISCRVLQVDPR
jgi:hypothetical protein